MEGEKSSAENSARSLSAVALLHKAARSEPGAVRDWPERLESARLAAWLQSLAPEVRKSAKQLSAQRQHVEAKLYVFEVSLDVQERAVWAKCTMEQRLLWLGEETARRSLHGEAERTLFSQLRERQRRAFARPLPTVRGDEAGGQRDSTEEARHEPRREEYADGECASRHFSQALESLSAEWQLMVDALLLCEQRSALASIEAAGDDDAARAAVAHMLSTTLTNWLEHLQEKDVEATSEAFGAQLPAYVSQLLRLAAFSQAELSLWEGLDNQTRELFVAAKVLEASADASDEPALTLSAVMARGRSMFQHASARRMDGAAAAGAIGAAGGTAGGAGACRPQDGRDAEGPSVGTARARDGRSLHGNGVPATGANSRAAVPLKVIAPLSSVGGFGRLDGLDPKGGDLSHSASAQRQASALARSKVSAASGATLQTFGASLHGAQHRVEHGAQHGAQQGRGKALPRTSGRLHRPRSLPVLRARACGVDDVSEGEPKRREGVTQRMVQRAACTKQRDARAEIIRASWHAKPPGNLAAETWKQLHLCAFKKLLVVMARACEASPQLRGWLRAQDPKRLQRRLTIEWEYMLRERQHGAALDDALRMSYENATPRQRRAQLLHSPAAPPPAHAHAQPLTEPILLSSAATLPPLSSMTQTRSLQAIYQGGPAAAHADDEIDDGANFVRRKPDAELLHGRRGASPSQYDFRPWEPLLSRTDAHAPALHQHAPRGGATAVAGTGGAKAALHRPTLPRKSFAPSQPLSGTFAPIAREDWDFEQLGAQRMTSPEMAADVDLDEVGEMCKQQQQWAADVVQRCHRTAELRCVHRQPH